MITSKEIDLFLYDTTDEVAYKPDDNMNWHLDAHFLWYDNYCATHVELIGDDAKQWYLDQQPEISYQALVDIENLDSEDVARFLEHYCNQHKEVKA